MTLQELTAHQRLREQLEEEKEILQSLRDRAYPGAQNLSGMPHGSDVRDKVGDLAIEIADMEDDIRRLNQKIKQQEIAVLFYIEQIEDARLRTIFRLRFIRGLTWKEVGAMLGGRNNEACVKASCYRYLDEKKVVTPCYDE